MIDEQKALLPDYEWIPMVCKLENNQGFFEYVSSFMEFVYTLLHGKPMPKVPSFLKEKL